MYNYSDNSSIVLIFISKIMKLLCFRSGLLRKRTVILIYFTCENPLCFKLSKYNYLVNHYIINPCKSHSGRRNRIIWKHLLCYVASCKESMYVFHFVNSIFIN